MIGPTPWLPGAVGRWLAEPIPATRLYAWRVGVGLFVILDVLLLYLADYEALYGPYGYTAKAISDPHFQPHRWLWSAFRWLPQGDAWLAFFAIWLVAAFGLMIGCWPRLAALVCWCCSVSALYANPDMHSGGDRLRCILLLLLIVSPLPTKGDARENRIACGWPAKYLLFQLAVMYFFAGVYKLRHPGWQNGSAMYYVLNNSTWCLTSKIFEPEILWRYGFFHLVSWGSVLWEMAFPLLVVIPWTRWRLGLGIGIAFHLLCAVFLQVSTFPWYSLACYLPLLPWERWFSFQRSA